MRILDVLGKIWGFILRVLKKIVPIVGLFATAALLMAFPIMWLWDFTMPDLLGLPEITFCKALALNLLTAILFKNTNK